MKWDDRIQQRKDWLEKQRELAHCTLRKPLWMVIPPEGAIISCPVHPDGHYVIGPPAIWSNV